MSNRRRYRSYARWISLVRRIRLFLIPAIALLLAGAAAHEASAYTLGPEIVVQAAGADLSVTGYSVPSLFDWNNDELPDLIVGEGGGGHPAGLVRIYLNVGSPGAPQFDDYFLAQAGGIDLYESASGCLGCAPRCVYWDVDGRKDLIVGTAQGGVRLYLNVATDESPAFDQGTDLYYLLDGVPTPIGVGARAVPAVVDWNSDGKKDLLVGALGGRIHIFINEGTDSAPVFNGENFAQEDGADLYVPSNRSSPVAVDVDGDGNKDLLAGNTNGETLLYSNVGSDEVPAFSGYVVLEGGGVPIDLPGAARSRVAIGDWHGDEGNDVLIGGGDGLVRLHLEVDPDSVPQIPVPRVQLAQPWPNPFNPHATISFTVREPTAVRVALYALDGRHVLDLADGSYSEGDYSFEWDGRDASGATVPSGTYLVRLESARERQVRKAMLVR